MNTQQSRKPGRWLLSAGLLLAMILVQAGPAASVVWAASFVVTNLNDSGAGSLRQAITNAQAAPGADEIKFSVSGTITLAGLLPPISDPAGLTINGVGQTITISGNNVVGVMLVLSGAPLTVKNLTIANGVVWGGIYNYGGILTVTDSTFSGNSTSTGGAISNFLGTATITDSTFSDNSAAYYGGAISNSRGSLTITGSTFSDNHAAYNGGGIDNTTGGKLTITGSTFSDNHARNGGGGIANDRGDMVTVMDSTFIGNSADGGGGIQSTGLLEITNSTFSANSATWGGGIQSLGPLTITNSTFFANSATWGGGGVSNALGSTTITGSTVSANSAGYFGGGINNFEDGVLTVTSSTISGNSAGNFGGGIDNSQGGVLTVTGSTFSANRAGIFGGGIRNYTGTASLKNNIIADSPSGRNCYGTFADDGYNIDDGTSCGFSLANHSYSGTDPLLDTDGLKDNGGPTYTIALRPGSPAIDAIPNGANGCGTTITADQRGFTRPQGAGCDIGAYELQNQPPIVSASGPYSVDEGASVLVTASGSDPEGGPLAYAWDLDQDGIFETPGQIATFSAVGLDGPGSSPIPITVQVTDEVNLTATSQATVNILNVAPTASFTNTSGNVIAGQSAWLAFSNPFDPGTADTQAGFLYSYDCNDDGAFELADSQGASYACAYPLSGDFSATGRIQDKDGGFTDYTVQVTVLTPRQGIEGIIESVGDLIGREVLNPGQGNALIAKLEAAIQQLDRGNDRVAINQLQAFIGQVEAWISSDTLSWDDGQPLIEVANEIIAVLSNNP